MIVTLAMIRAAQNAARESGHRLDTYTVQAMLKAAWEAERIRLVESTKE